MLPTLNRVLPSHSCNSICVRADSKKLETDLVVIIGATREITGEDYRDYWRVLERLLEITGDITGE